MGSPSLLLLNLTLKLVPLQPEHQKRTHLAQFWRDFACNSTQPTSITPGVLLEGNERLASGVTTFAPQSRSKKLRTVNVKLLTNALHWIALSVLHLISDVFGKLYNFNTQCIHPLRSRRTKGAEDG